MVSILPPHCSSSLHDDVVGGGVSVGVHGHVGDQLRGVGHHIIKASGRLAGPVVMGPLITRTKVVHDLPVTSMDQFDDFFASNGY